MPAMMSACGIYFAWATVAYACKYTKSSVVKIYSFFTTLHRINLLITKTKYDQEKNIEIIFFLFWLIFVFCPLSQPTIQYI